MLGGMHFIEHDIMNVVSSSYSGSKEDMENKKKVVIQDATKIHPRDKKKCL